MTQTILTPTMITREALRLLHNNLVFCKRINRQYDSKFAQSGGKIGASLDIRKPAQYTVGTGASITPQEHIEEKATVTVATQKHVAVSFTSTELTLSLDDFSERVLAPAMARLASEVDYVTYLNALTSGAYNYAGTPGSTPASANVWLDAGRYLDDQAAPRDGQRFAVMDPAANAATVAGLSGLFNPSSGVSAQYKDGLMSTALGLEMAMSQNVRNITTGTVSNRTSSTQWQTNEGSGMTDGDSSMDLDTGTGTIKAGEVFTIADCYDVNPETKQTLPYLKRFVCTADYTSGTISFAPALYSAAAGARQNCSLATLAAGNIDNKKISLLGSASTAYANNLVFHRDFMTLVTADLEDVSKFGAWGARVTEDGISLRIARQYAISTDAIPCRIDVLFGSAVLRGEHACRVMG